jgi:hypothetical protein
MNSKIIYLYLKTHNITGLKYLGKTVQDPFKYCGSGKYWLRHIDKHSYDVTTEIIFQTDDKEEFKKVALEYSKKWNIVESKGFANLIPENGDGGGGMENTKCIYKNGIIRYIKKDEIIPSGWTSGMPEYVKANISKNRIGKGTGPSENKKLAMARPDVIEKMKHTWDNRGEKNPFHGKKHSILTNVQVSQTKIGQNSVAECNEKNKNILKEFSKYLRGEKVYIKPERKFNHFEGYTHTEESKQKMSEAGKGEKNAMFGKTHSSTARCKIATSKLNRSAIVKDIQETKNILKKLPDIRNKAEFEKYIETHRKKKRLYFFDNVQYEKFNEIITLTGLTPRQVRKHDKYSYKLV